MKRLRLMLSLAVLCAIVATMAVPPTAGAAISQRGNGMMEAINAARARAGLHPLNPAPRLIRSSRARSELMIEADFFAHPSRLRVPTFDQLGEVLELHGSYQPRPNRVLRRWANSPGHRAVIMSRTYRWVGAARAIGRYRGYRTTIWVVRFGKR